MSETYSVIVTCHNCTFHGEVEISKGSLVTQKVCPTCGCAKLSKSSMYKYPSLGRGIAQGVDPNIFLCTNTGGYGGKL